jgi:hypothetical protein
MDLLTIRNDNGTALLKRQCDKYNLNVCQGCHNIINLIADLEDINQAGQPGITRKGRNI